MESRASCSTPLERASPTRNGNKRTTTHAVVTALWSGCSKTAVRPVRAISMKYRMALFFRVIDVQGRTIENRAAVLRTEVSTTRDWALIALTATGQTDVKTEGAARQIHGGSGSQSSHELL